MARLAACFAWLFLIGAAHAIDPNRAVSQYLHDRWAPEQGFPWGPVYAIGQTADGYLWIGTGAGLIRFDGFSFRVVKDDSGAFTITSVPELKAANDGCLWLRLPDLTLLRYCNGAFENPSSDSQQNAIASAMSRTDRGEILIADSDKGALAFRGGGFRLLASASDLSRTPLTALAQTPNGDIWIGTRDAGVFRFAEQKTSPILNALPGAKINCLLPDGDRGLWIGTDDGIARWDGSRITSAGIPASLRGFQVLSLARDRDANLWVGSGSHGLLRFNSQGVASMNAVGGDSREAVTALFEDREGDLWIGSASGLERLRDSTFVTYSLPEGLPTDGNNPVFVDSENRMWFPPVRGGLWWSKDEQHGRVSAGGLDQDVVYSIAGGNGELWLGRQHGGLTRLRSHDGSFTAESYTQADGLAQNSVFSVYRSRDGGIWAGTLSGGVSKLAGGKFTTYTIASGLASNTVSSILESQDGTTWFATPDGLSALSNGHWRTYTRKDGLPSVNVNCLLQDSKGVLWIGTTAGLAFGDSRGFRVPAEVPAILQEQVLGIAEDSFGWLWMSTSSHVMRVKRDKLMSGATADGDIREFGLADGLRGVEGVKRHRSVVTDPLGRIWFSLNRGISSVDPARLAQNSVPAIVHVHTVSADNIAIALRGSVHVPRGRQRITFGFTGLSLSAPERVLYRYRLDGFDRGWSKPSATPEATYTNLAPGPYRFRVIASNPDGVWNTDEAALTLEVDPLYWQTWWFGVIVALTCIFAIAALYRMHLHQVTGRLNIRFEERLAERNRIAQELHDTLLQGFLSASMQVHVANDRLPDDSKVKPALTRALQLMGQVIDEGRNALRGLRSTRSASLDLEQALAHIQEEMLPEAHAGDPFFRVIVDGERRPLHPAVRDEMYRIGREALINAFRHAHAKSIDVGLIYSPRHLRLFVRDDGCGIDPQIIESGREGHWGLIGMRERSERIGGRLRVFSSATAGTEVDLSVPGSIAFEDHRSPALKWFRAK